MVGVLGAVIVLSVRVSAELLAVIGCTGTLSRLFSGLSTLLDSLLIILRVVNRTTS